MRVGSKLTLAVGFVLVCVAIGYGAVFLTAQRQFLAEVTSANGARAAALVGAAHAQGMADDALGRLAGGVAANLGIVRAELLRGGLRVPLWHAEAPAADALEAAYALDDTTRLRLWLVPTPHDAALFSGRHADLATVVLVTLVLLFIVQRQARLTVAQPLGRLSATVERFGHGEMTLRHPSGEPGEIGLLADRFNHMADTIARQTRDLMREREYERSLVQNISSAIIGLDAAGAVTTWNQAMANLTGIAPTRALGTPLAALQPACLPPEVLGHVTDLLAGRRQRFDLEEVEFEGCGVERTLDMRGRVLHGPDGSPYGVLLAIDDRTQQARLTEQLRHAEKLATVGQLAAGLAHEIGTPLNVISGRAEFLLKKLPEDDDLRRHLNSIVKQIDRISGIVSQMLLFARKQPPRKSRFDLAALAGGVAELLSHQVAQCGTELRLTVPRPLCLTADPDQIQQVLMNLLLNALQALGSGGAIDVAAEACTVPDKGNAPFVRLTVRDTGPGMSDAVLNRIFDPFYTTKEPGRGTGMGLTVAHGIITTHGGWIEVESRLGAGSTFTVFLPVEADAAARPESV
ncbi:MAG: PAS domain-containing protein [Nitrospirae bacterium]|nr:PAS domain-containing protein [Nitrospirota bacterium]